MLICGNVIDYDIRMSFYSEKENKLIKNIDYIFSSIGTNIHLYKQMIFAF